MMWLGMGTPSSGQEVEVHVIDHLATFRPAAHAHTIAAIRETLGLAQTPRYQETPTDDLDVILLHRHDGGDVALGDDEDVDGRLRVDVLEGEDGVVLVLDLRRALAGHDPAKRAVRHGLAIIRARQLSLGRRSALHGNVSEMQATHSQEW